jgi:hypothetical protein
MKLFTRSWRLVAGLIFSLGLILAMSGGSVLVASAAPGPSHKETICHRTGSQTNPYVKITVANSSIDGSLANGHGQGDHFAQHTGPIFPATGSDGKWGDIIPPLAGVHNGMNWTAEGQAIYDDGCKLGQPLLQTPPLNPTPTPTANPTPTGGTTPTPASHASPSPSATPSGDVLEATATPAPTGGVLAATGATAPGLGLGLLLMAFGTLAMAAGAIAWMRRKA